MSRKSTGVYPVNWKEIATAAKDEAGWQCVRCGHPHDPSVGRMLTVHHLDMNPANNLWWNLLVLDQKCHLQVQARVILERPWLLEHSEWFKPYVGGWAAYFYLGMNLSRDEVMANLDYYVDLQRNILIGVES